MQVKCEYCGSWINDTDEKCPNCSAANAKLTRVASDTPKTIEELKEWYKARKLPPYETTRFFIGTDYKKPKAFGIYKDGNKFVVYKNKADGKRAIRYNGTDEAYAVNEIYLRLKEEILNQKNLNTVAKSRSSKPTATTSRSGCLGWLWATTSRSGCLGWLWNKLKIPLLMINIPFILLVIVIFVDSFNPQSASYYLSKDGSTLFYCVDKLATGEEEWWTAGTDNPVWTRYRGSLDDRGFPADISKDELCGTIGNYNDMLQEVGLPADTSRDTSPYNILNCRDYIDMHHSAPSDSAYYCVDGKTYYYLNDPNGASFGKRNNSGWYIYEDDDWEYYCSDSDHNSLGDDLWYDDEKYSLGSSYSGYRDAYVSGDIYNYTGTAADSWSTAVMAQAFEDTTWYGEKIAADEAYVKYQEEHRSESSESDSDYDWDSSDSWDSGGTDWDSDW